MFDLFTKATSIGFIVLFSILFIATIIVFTLNCFNKLTLKTYGELKNRLKTWFIIIVGLLLIFSINKTVSLIGWCGISLLAFHEYTKSTNLREADKKVITFTFFMIPIQYLWIAMNWYAMAMIFIPVYLFLSVPLFLILSKESFGFLKSVGTIYWGTMACVFCLSHVAVLFTLNIPSNAHYNAISLIFILLLLTEINDVLQYLWGKTLGKTKILPTISPNKTLAGLFGGIITTTFISFLITPYFTPFTHIESLGIGLIIGIAGFIGDICMSAIKRDLGVKDYSSLLPGHGGVLDRLDSLIYTAPLFFHILHYSHF